jgi:hypothetical protein
MATYNCSDSTNNAYGQGAYGTCSTQTVGAPNTGVFEQVISSGSFTIIVPLVAAIIVVVIASLVVKQRKRS